MSGSSYELVSFSLTSCNVGWRETNLNLPLAESAMFLLERRKYYKDEGVGGMVKGKDGRKRW